MMELPEAVVIAEQINGILKGKKIARVTANHSPHKFAWFFGDPEIYDDLLAGETVEQAAPYGGMVEITAGGAKIVFSEGINLRILPGKNCRQSTNCTWNLPAGLP